MGNRNILKLLLSFLKIGLFTFGGGYAMIPLIQREMVEKHQWITSDELLEMVAISESTPGPIAVNIATFVGYRVGGVLGSFCATVGVILPAFFIIVVISLAIKKFENLKMVRYGFMGIRAGVLALICKALVSMYRECGKNPFSYIVMAATFILVAFLNVNVLTVLIMCAGAGLIYYSLIRGKTK